MALRILKNRADAEDSDTGCFYSLGYGAVERNGLAGVAGEEQVAGSGEVEEVAQWG